MISVGFAPKFVRNYAKLEPALGMEVKETIELLKDRSNHEQLKVHKLGGYLADRYDCSVNYKTRIVFRYLDSKTISCLNVGDHDVYKS